MLFVTIQEGPLSAQDQIAFVRIVKEMPTIVSQVISNEPHPLTEEEVGVAIAPKHVLNKSHYGLVITVAASPFPERVYARNFLAARLYQGIKVKAGDLTFALSLEFSVDAFVDATCERAPVTGACAVDFDLNRRISALPLVAPATDWLRQHGIATTRQLVSYKPQALKALPGITEHIFYGIVSALYEKGLWLKPEPAPQLA